ncbi:drab5 [Anaeramoeba ignava]|uniref:Drab5 n=1 Tax=Anaeramoeba ignava TaxID=1746090 RepID=A0A9Q0LPC1_ANAIG|nr:drab5 [Anaeramoeba ignava]
MNPIKTYQFKVVLIGESDVGKTCLVLRLTKGIFQSLHVTTIGSSFYTKTFSFEEDEEVKMEIWDTAGQERYNSLTRMYFRGAVGAICVYDITNKNTFVEAKKRVEDLKNESPDSIVLLIGNKIDLESQREVKDEEAAQYAEENGFLFYETSAVDGAYVEESFKALASLFRHYYNNPNFIQEYTTHIKFNEDEKNQQKKKCC